MNVNTYKQKNKAFIVNKLHETCIKKETKKLQKILQENNNWVDIKDDKSGWTPLMIAAHFDFYDGVKVLLDFGANANYSEPNKNNTPLLCAIAAGENAKSYFPLLNDKNINRANKDGITPLMLACEVNNSQAVEDLLNKGANLSDYDKNGKTCLDYALKRNNHKIISLIESLNIGKAVVNKNKSENINKI